MQWKRNEQLPRHARHVAGPSSAHGAHDYSFLLPPCPWSVSILPTSNLAELTRIHCVPGWYGSVTENKTWTICRMLRLISFFFFGSVLHQLPPLTCSSAGRGGSPINLINDMGDQNTRLNFVCNTTNQRILTFFGDLWGAIGKTHDQRTCRIANGGASARITNVKSQCKARLSSLVLHWDLTRVMSGDRLSSSTLPFLERLITSIHKNVLFNEPMKK